jgi:2,4'-dihydroxyacetophenone dioxygenase
MDLNLSHQTDYVFKSANPVLGFAVAEKEAVWIPYEPGTANRFLMFDLNTNSFAVVLRCAPGSGIDRHYHTGSVAGYCLQGSWKYKESDWIARPGTFVYERPGEAHTLQILGDETMMSFFHVMGPHITLDAGGREIGYVDAFRLLEYCRRYSQENGLDSSYLEKITR